MMVSVGGALVTMLGPLTSGAGCGTDYPRVQFVRRRAG